MLRRNAIAITATTLLLGGIVLFSQVEKVDDGYIINTETGAIDPVGALKLAFTRATRDCTLVKDVDATYVLAALTASKVDQINKGDPRPRAGWTQDRWLLTEVEFESLEPAVILLERVADSYKVSELYGGTAAPFNDVQAIHTYFLQQRIDAPRQLINCYEPVGAPFDRAS